MTSLVTSADAIVDLSKKIARALKDPTTDSRGNKIEMTVEDRAKKRDAAYEDLCDCIEMLGNLANIAEAYSDMAILAKKYE